MAFRCSKARLIRSAPRGLAVRLPGAWSRGLRVRSLPFAGFTGLNILARSRGAQPGGAGLHRIYSFIFNSPRRDGGFLTKLHPHHTFHVDMRCTSMLSPDCLVLSDILQTFVPIHCLAAQD